MRLCDVAPDGASTLVTRGSLNLTHRDSHEHPRPLDAGRALPGDASRLNAIGHALRRRATACGSRLAHLLAVGLAVARAGHADA